MNRRRLRVRPRGARRIGLLAMMSVTLLASACGASEEVSGDANEAAGRGQLSIVATTNILGDVTENIVGDAAEVTVLMPPGSDPHNFEASAQQLAEMQQADLVVANGGGLEQQLADALAETERAEVPVFHAIDHVDTLAFEDNDEHGDEHADEHGLVDPHFWMDPTRMAAVVDALATEVEQLSDDASGVEDRAGEYTRQLTDVDAETQEMLASIPADQRKFVTNHEAFGYFADRYDFEVVGTVIPSVSTGAEPSAQDLEALARTIEEEQVTAVFTESIGSNQLAEVLADEVGSGVEVVELYSDSLGEEGSEAATYLDLLRTNAARVSNALVR